MKAPLLAQPQSIPKRPSDLFPAPLYSRSMAVRIEAAELLANNKKEYPRVRI